MRVDKIYIHLLGEKISALLICLLIISCASSTELKRDISINLANAKQLMSGQNLQIDYEDSHDYNEVLIKLKSINTDSEIESYGIQEYSNSYVINRFLNKDIDYNDSYYLEASFSGSEDVEVKNIDIDILPSVIIKSFCSSENCSSLSGNIVQNTLNTLSVSFYRIAPIKIEYIITTPYDEYRMTNEFSSPVSEDWLANLSFREVLGNYSSYINTVIVKAYDTEGNIAETALPFKVVRPIEVKHFGQHELAETYEPVPVTGCIPGSLGNNVQYSESTSETKQNSVSMTFSNSWSNSDSSTINVSQSEGVSIGETSNTILSSSLSDSETISESEAASYSEGSSDNISFSTSDGESWGWNIDESESQGTSNSNTSSTNLGVNGSVTTGFSGEGSLPFLAKVSGKVEVTAGASANWGNSETSGENESSTNSRGYSTGGTNQSGRTFGSITNDSRSHSLSGSYVLSSSTSNTITEASGKSSSRVWNMSESVASGKIVSVGNSESLAETIVDSSSSSTTFSYSAYIPRGRYGVFYRQTSRYVKLSEIITYDLNGFPIHSGFIAMNSWAWAPELSIGNDCNDMPVPNLPEAICHIPPCGE